MPDKGNSDGVAGESTDERTHAEPVSRRSVLRASALGVSALATGVGTAGATETDGEADYAAGPVALDEEATEEGYRILDHERFPDETSEGVVYESSTVAYRGEGVSYGVYVTPDLASEGHEPSTPAAASPESFLGTDAGRFLLRSLGVRTGERGWTEGPEAFAENLGDSPPVILDAEAEMLSLVGAVAEHRAALIHVARATVDGDVVFVADARVRTRTDGDQPLLDDDDAVFPLPRQEEWCDTFIDFVPSLVPVYPLPPCLGTSISRSTTVEIVNPSVGEVINNGSPPRDEATMHQAGKNVPIIDKGRDGYAVEIEPRAKVTFDCNDFDHLEWTYELQNGFCGRNGEFDGGTGERTTIELVQCGCYAAQYRITVQAVASDGTVVASDTVYPLLNIVNCL